MTGLPSIATSSPRPSVVTLCPQDHPLFPTNAPDDTPKCHLCETPLPPGAPVMACVACGYLVGRCCSQDPTELEEPSALVPGPAPSAAATAATTAPQQMPKKLLQWHGSLGNPNWAQPKCVVQSDEIARPGYGAVKASEFMDAPDVLAEKVDMLVHMITAAENMVAYTGAGISTAAGIQDYASRATGSVVQAAQGLNRRQLPPTIAHRTLAALEKAGFVKHWLQQNHDGLAQKAGFPFWKLNEIHGSWWDKSNPVVKMSGSLRSDLSAWMAHWEETADFVLGVGTSFSGMAADCVACETAERAAQGVGLGLCIVNLQHTQQDKAAQLRIYAKLDDVMKMVAKKLKLTLGTVVHPAAPSAKDLTERRKVFAELKIKERTSNPGARPAPKPTAKAKK